MDHRSGAALKVHWSFDSPATESRNIFLLACRLLIARSRSPWLKAPADRSGSEFKSTKAHTAEKDTNFLIRQNLRNMRIRQ
jgi:hypothetical protein